MVTLNGQISEGVIRMINFGPSLGTECLLDKICGFELFKLPQRVKKQSDIQM